MDKMSGIGDLEYERRRDDRVRAVVEFDTHGITDQCPAFGNVTFDECERCNCYISHSGFRVFCSYSQ